MRGVLLAVLVVLAALSGCVQSTEPPTGNQTSPGSPDPGDVDGANGSDPRTPDANTSGPGSAGGDPPTYLIVDVGPVESDLQPSDPAFRPLLEELRGAWDLIIDPSNGTDASLGAVDPNAVNASLVALRLNETWRRGMSIPQPPGADGRVNTVVAVLESPNATLEDRILLCWGEGTCRGYRTQSSLDPLRDMAALFSPAWIRYDVNGTHLQDHFRAHGWVHVSVPIHGTLNITGTEDDGVYAEDACVSERDENNTTRRTCGEELRQQQVFIDGHATRWPASENNTADLMISETGIYGTIDTPTQRIELHPVERPDGTFVQQAQADSGQTAVRLFLTASDPPTTNGTVTFDEDTVFDGTVHAREPGIPGATTPFFAWNTTRVNLTVEREGRPLEGPGNLTLDPVSFVYIHLLKDRYIVNVEDHRRIEG